LDGDLEPIDAGVGHPSLRTGTMYVVYNLGISGVPQKQQITAVHIPRRLHPVGPVDVVLYLHGHKDTDIYDSHHNLVSEDWDPEWNPTLRAHQTKNYKGIAEYLRVRGLLTDVEQGQKSLVFVAPTLSQHASSGDLTNPTKLQRFLDEVMKWLTVYGPYQVTPHLGNLILAAHSGGGSSMLTIAGFRDDVPECWGFDCVYGPEILPPKGTLTAKALDDWADEHYKKNSVESRWVIWSGKQKKRFRAFCSKTKNTNLEMLDLLSQYDGHVAVDVNPHFYQDGPNGSMERIPGNPRANVPAHHDVMTQYLTPCIQDCASLHG
jgi:hypothetical protein